MMSQWYRTVTTAINRRPGTLALLTLILVTTAHASLGTSQDSPAPRSDAPVLVRVVGYLRAHPNMAGDITLVRHERAHGRTSTEHGTLRLSVEGAHVTLGESEIALSLDTIESFDASTSPPMLLSLRGETPVARYAALIAGEDPSSLWSERVLARRDGRVEVELVPRAPWLGLERAVLRVLDEGPDAGRIERCLWLDGLGNWQRVDLEAVRHPSRIEPSSLRLGPHADARRVEL